jgi:hypothetical protein
MQGDGARDTVEEFDTIGPAEMGAGGAGDAVVDPEEGCQSCSDGIKVKAVTGARSDLGGGVSEDVEVSDVVVSPQKQEKDVELTSALLPPAESPPPLLMAPSIDGVKCVLCVCVVLSLIAVYAGGCL